MRPSLNSEIISTVTQNAIPPKAEGSPVLAAILERRAPPRFAYAPNYWQWFAHARDHGALPPAIAHCRSQLEMIQALGLDVFSRNVYSDERDYWFGGLCDVVWDGVEFEETVHEEGRDRVSERVCHTRRGTLRERLRFIHGDTTLVQEKFLVDDYATQLDALEALLRGRSWRFIPERWRRAQAAAGERGLVIAGELYSPLKMLHLTLGAPQTTFLLAFQPERAAGLLALHEAAHLDLVRQMARAGVRVMMAMDNLDSAFHPPQYVEQYSASFYEKASRICHEFGSLFFIHACGRQRANLKLIAGLGVDGLEGVAFPPLGDVELDEALKLAGERMIVTGGIGAHEFERLRTRQEVYAYVQDLFARLSPHAHRFVLAASCMTPYNAPWETIEYFRDAWLEYGEL